MASDSWRCHDPCVRTTLLIVDDHAAFRRLARRLLQAEGFEVVGEAEHGHAALAAVERFHPDVVLLDVLLPDIDGFEVAARMAEQPLRPRVVLTSSREAQEFGDRVQTSAAVGFVQKKDLTGESLARAAGVTP
jgi:two-component system nitrate/nitrite response regulator NarL